MNHNPSEPVAHFLAKLSNPKQTAKGWKDRCPAHDDSSPSLEISQGDDGRALVHCFGGCTPEAIVGALGLTMRDLMPEKPNGNASHSSCTSRPAKKSYPTREKVIEVATWKVHQDHPDWILAKQHDYPEGYHVLRFEPVGGGDKTFVPIHEDAEGWHLGDPDGLLPLYHRDDIKPGAAVYVFEGEKATDAAKSTGITPAITSAHGSKSASSTDWSSCAGCDLFIFPDNDDAGRSYAEEGAKITTGLNPPARVRIVALPDLPDGGDVADYINARECIDPDEIRAGILKLADAAPLWSSQPEKPDETIFKFHSADQFDALDLRRDYHVPGILAAGPVPTVLAGSFKSLKTSIAADLGLSLATCTRFLNHFQVNAAVNVGMMSGESGGYALQSLLRRIAHSRGWTLAGVQDRLHICTSVLNLGSPEHMDEVERFIMERDIKAFMVDPTYLAMSQLRGDDAGNLFAMGASLKPMARLGDRTGCTPILIHHNSRGATRANPNEPAELQDIAWSGFAEWAGQWLLLARRERYDPDSNGHHKLWLTAGGRDGHSTLVGVNVTEGHQNDPGGRRWDVEVEQASQTRRATVEAEQDRREQDRQTRQQVQAEQDRATVLAVLKLLPDGETKTTIRDRSGLRGERFNPVFASLLADGLVVSCTISKANKREYSAYKLSQPDASGRIGTEAGQKPRPGAVASETDAPPKGGVPSDAMQPVTSECLKFDEASRCDSDVKR